MWSREGERSRVQILANTLPSLSARNRKHERSTGRVGKDREGGFSTTRRGVDAPFPASHPRIRRLASTEAPRPPPCPYSQYVQSTHGKKNVSRRPEHQVTFKGVCMNRCMNAYYICMSSHILWREGRGRGDEIPGLSCSGSIQSTEIAVFSKISVYTVMRYTLLVSFVPFSWLHLHLKWSSIGRLSVIQKACPLCPVSCRSFFLFSLFLVFQSTPFTPSSFPLPFFEFAATTVSIYTDNTMGCV